MITQRATDRRIRLGFALPAVIVCLAACGGADVDVHPADADPFGSSWSDRTLYEETLVDGVVLDDLSRATVYHIDLVIPPDFQSVEGRQWVRYTNQEDKALEEIYFQLFPNTGGGRTTVSALNVGDIAVLPVFEHLDGAMRVPLPHKLAPGEAITLQVDFSVEVGQEMGGTYGLLGYFDGYLVLDGFYPVIPVYDDEGWNVDDPPSVGDVTYLDSSFYLVRVTAPRAVDLVASGGEIEQDRIGRNQVVTLAAGPARDFYLAAAADLVQVSDQVGPTVITSFASRRQREGGERALQFARDALALFDEQVGPYPYTEFNLIGTPMRALGVEYPGMTTISSALYDLDSVVADVPASIMLEGTVAHEVAHQWFYNVVGNDQVDEPWLDEALAQYLTGLYYRSVYGDQAEQDYRQSWTSRWDRIGEEPIPIGLSTSEYTAEEYSPIVYGRGPLFVAALEDLMGREEFASFLRDYYQANMWGIATTRTFRVLAEHHCGCDLGEMFEDWVEPST